MKKEHLHLLIDEEIYLIGSEVASDELRVGEAEVESEESLKSKVAGNVEESLEKSTITEPIEEEKQASETTRSKPQAEEIVEESVEEPTVSEHTDETPNIPSRDEVASIPSVKYAFFHNTDQTEELDLLNKIIAACKLNENDFKVLKVGQEIAFQKAVVFTKAGPSYYEVTNHEKGIVMYSQPLVILLNSKEEKAKLWGALQSFVK